MNYLFIAGCARSGTTALARLLNRDDRIIVGIERFIDVVDTITVKDFDKEKFLNPLPTETHSLNPELYERFRSKWDREKVKYLGDKVPRYYRQMDRLVNEFPDCKIVFLWRDLQEVASSYNVRVQKQDGWPKNRDYQIAVKDWNESLGCLRGLVRRGYSRQIHVVRFEAFFSGDMPSLESLYEFLALTLRHEDRRIFIEQTKNWPSISSKPLALTGDMIAHLEKHKDRRLEMWMSKFLS